MDTKTRFSIGYFVFILLAMALMQNLLLRGPKYEPVAYSEFRQLLKENRVESVKILSDRLRGKRKGKDARGSERHFETAKVPDPGLIKDLEEAGVEFQGQYEPPWPVQFITNWLLPLGVLMAVYAFCLAQDGSRPRCHGLWKEQGRRFVPRQM